MGLASGSCLLLLVLLMNALLVIGERELTNYIVESNWNESAGGCSVVVRGHQEIQTNYFCWCTTMCNPRGKNKKQTRTPLTTCEEGRGGGGGGGWDEGVLSKGRQKPLCVCQKEQRRQFSITTHSETETWTTYRLTWETHLLLPE